jgi:ATP-dependent helicase/nuclease subunit A
VRVEVWRERPFEVILDGIWYTGIFDRVVVERDAQGQATKAWVMDYKTGRITMAVAVERHAGQINLYRRVVAVLTGITVESVRCTLVLTESCQSVEVPPAY